MASSLLPKWQRWALAVLITLIVGSLLVVLRNKGKLEPFELAHYDWTTSAISQRTQAEDVILVAISDHDLGQWGWPIPDAQLAQIVENLLEAGAAAVGVDIYRDVPAGAGRESLLEALDDPKVVVISKLPGEDGSGIAAPPGVRTGFSDIPIDTDGVARRALLLVSDPQGISLSFSMQLATEFTRRSVLQSDPSNPSNLMFGNTVVPPLNDGSNLFRNVDTSGYQIIIDYKNALPIANQIPAEDVLAGRGLDHIRDKVAIIGVTSQSVKDYFGTPLNRSTGASFTYGAEIHAAIFQQLVGYTYGSLLPLRPLNSSLSSIVIFASVFAGACIAVFVRVTAKSIVLAVGGCVALILAMSFFQKSALLMPVAPSALGWFLGFSSAFAIISGVSRNQRRAIVQVFSSHLSDELSAEIWKQRKSLLTGGKPKSRRLFVTALLADIEGSTSIGKSMDAESFMAWVSRILDKLGEIARRHGGFVEKYTGDGILVIFGAPIPSDTRKQRQDDALSALRCAREMRAAALELNRSTDGHQNYRLRIALNSGEAFGGTLGVSGSMRYNVIGDTINVTARLEGWIKTLDEEADGMRPVCMSKQTATIIDSQKEWPEYSSFVHDDGETRIEVIKVPQASD
jgi:adenylate cyclase